MKMRVPALLALVSVALLVMGCPRDTPGRNYRQEMREFVEAISDYAKDREAGFEVIPQNGLELLTTNGRSNGTPAEDYIAAIDAVGREDLVYGFNFDNIATPAGEREYQAAFLDVAEANGVEALVTDYCWTPSKVDDSYAWNNQQGYISFAAPSRELDIIPTYPAHPYGENSDDIGRVAEARNFLYILNPGDFATKADFLAALQDTNYDVLIIDAFFDDEPLSAADVASLKTKENGGARRVMAYMSIGEAENYRYYWQAGWRVGSPSWIYRQNLDWPGNYVVRYWDDEWQEIILGGEGSYLQRILDAGFDGVYLDIVDAFESFE